MLRRTILLTLLLLANFAFSLTSRADAVVTPDEVAIQPKDSGLDPLWAKKAVFMEIYVRGYKDSNGDGIGDLNGVTQSLDYLKDLGIRGIWLMPITESGDHDHGYWPTDYRKVEADYGTLADFKELVRQAHKRDIGIIIDYVINHSGSEHPIFQDASASKTAKYRNWYIWSDKKPKNWNTFSGDPWHHIEGRGYYYGVFGNALPDWNLRNPAVLNYHFNNMKFWLNAGADGFRFDATSYLIENSNKRFQDQPENHVLMHKIHDLLDQYGKRYMTCESPSNPEAYAVADSCGGAFAFRLQEKIIKSVRYGRVMPDLDLALDTLPLANMNPLLSSHDSYAGMRPFDQFHNDGASYRLAAATYLTLPGIPFIYYGEEIAMSGTHKVDIGDHELRAPMSWAPDPATGGFTRNKAKIFRPVADNVMSNNVELEKSNPDSMLNHYNKLLAIRNHHPAMQLGDYKRIKTTAKGLYSFTRTYANETLYVVFNYSKKKIKTTVSSEIKNATLIPLLARNTAALKTDSTGAIMLEISGEQLEIYQVNAKN